MVRARSPRSRRRWWRNLKTQPWMPMSGRCCRGWQKKDSCCSRSEPMETPRPFSLLCELTYRCPLQCPYCSNPIDFARHAAELSAEEWERVLAEAAKLGVVQAHFSGGEPLVRADAP